jgi:hypothetical protein
VEFLKVPEWAKIIFMIDTEKLLKKRSDSTVINSNINSKNTTVNWNWSNNILVKELSYERNSIGLIGKQSKEKIIINEKKHRSTIRKLFKLLKAAFVQMEKQNMKLNTTEMIMIEWKELGRRVDYIMLFLSLFTIIITPILLFGNFFIRDVITESHLSTPCGCEHSFVKNI